MAGDEIFKILLFVIGGIALIIAVVPGFRDGMAQLTGLAKAEAAQGLETVQSQDLRNECNMWMHSFAMKSSLTEDLIYHATVNLPEDVSWDFCDPHYEDDYDKCRAACIYLTMGAKACEADPNVLGDVDYGQKNLERVLKVERCVDRLIRGTEDRMSIKDCVNERILNRDWFEGCRT
jgi:hypothetical protein